MKIQSHALPGLAALILCGATAEAAPTQAAAAHRPLHLAQAGPDSTTLPTSDGGATAPPAADSTPDGMVAAPPESGQAKLPGATLAPAQQLPVAGGTERNNAGALPSLAQPGAAGGLPTSPSISYGGPQTDSAPIYGGTTRDPGGMSGALSPSGVPLPIGGPINGTANAYITPPGSTYGGSAGATGRDAGGRAGSGNSLPPQGSTATTNLQPLGGLPNTRDQLGVTGGVGGYNQQGVYNGTAVQSGVNGYGPASSYATVGRLTGGLLSTNVDATGPLRPYIPLDGGPLGRPGIGSGRPNSGYGISNGSRPSHIDGRGIQRMD